jgi:hypothetical protein
MKGRNRISTNNAKCGVEPTVTNDFGQSVLQLKQLLVLRVRLQTAAKTISIGFVSDVNAAGKSTIKEFGLTSDLKVQTFPSLV